MMKRAIAGDRRVSGEPSQELLRRRGVIDGLLGPAPQAPALRPCRVPVDEFADLFEVEAGISVDDALPGQELRRLQLQRRQGQGLRQLQQWRQGQGHDPGLDNYYSGGQDTGYNNYYSSGKIGNGARYDNDDSGSTHGAGYVDNYNRGKGGRFDIEEWAPPPPKWDSRAPRGASSAGAAAAPSGRTCVTLTAARARRIGTDAAAVTTATTATTVPRATTARSVWILEMVEILYVLGPTCALRFSRTLDPEISRSRNIRAERRFASKD